MHKFNILKWCDEKMSYLKNHGIKIKNGIPQLPKEFVYRGVPKRVTTFLYRRDIPETEKSDSLLCFFMFETNLWARLYKIDSDIHVMKEYGGVVGFDLSPCLNMLRPRQRLSILINAIHACYCGLAGVKVLPNYRPGDIGTVCAADFFPDDCSFMVGNLGCIRNGYKDYGDYTLKMILRKKHANPLFTYGPISKTEAKYLADHYGISIIAYPDRRNRVRNNSKTYLYHYAGEVFCKDVLKGGEIYGC